MKGVEHTCSECSNPACVGSPGFLPSSCPVEKTWALLTVLLLPQGESISKDDDVFYDPEDEWEQDISASSGSASSSFSRRR